MKKTLHLIAPCLLGFLLVSAAHCQSDQMVHVKSFPGVTVGDKISAAMGHCPSAGPCILVIDASMASYAEGTMPALCAQCSLADFRYGGMAGVSSDGTGGAQAARFAAGPHAGPHTTIDGNGLAFPDGTSEVTSAAPLVEHGAGDTICALHADSTIGAITATAANSTASTITYTFASVPNYIFPGMIVQTQGFSPAGFNAGPLTVSATTSTTVTVLSGANPGAATAFGTLSLYCSNQQRDGGGSWTQFQTSYAMPANVFGLTRSSWDVHAQMIVFASASPPFVEITPFLGGAMLLQSSNAFTPYASLGGVNGDGEWTITALSPSLAMTTNDYISFYGAGFGYFGPNGGSLTSQPMPGSYSAGGALTLGLYYQNNTAGNAIVLVGMTVR